MIEINKIVVDSDSKDDTDRPIQNINYLGRKGSTEAFFPYGMHANVPKGFLGVLFTILKQASNRMAMFSSGQERIKVATGEVVFFHPATKAKTHYKNDGSIVTKTKFCTIVAKADGELNVNGATITADGKVITKEGVDLDAFKAEYDDHKHTSIKPLHSDGTQTGSTPV